MQVNRRLAHLKRLLEMSRLRQLFTCIDIFKTKTLEFSKTLQARHGFMVRFLVFFVVALTSVNVCVYTYTRVGGPAQFGLTGTATAATSNNLNYQARLLNANGTIVADGYYNIEFKLYNIATGGSALWTENYHDANGTTTGQDNRVRVVNGYMSVNLGSQTAFPNMDWDQDLWLTMNVGGNAQTATPSYDGEMNPRIKLTAVPYAFQAKRAEQLSQNQGAYTATLNFATLTGNRTITIPDADGVLCMQNSASCGFVTGSAANYIQNGTTPQTADFNITGGATIGTNLNVSGTTTLTGPLIVNPTAGTEGIIAQASAGISSGAITMSAAQNTVSFTTSAAITLNPGDYVRSDTTGQGRAILTGGNGTSFTINNTIPFTSAITNETFTIYRPLMKLRTNSGAEALTVINTASGGTLVGINNPAPRETLDVNGNIRLTATLQVGSGLINLGATSGVNILNGGSVGILIQSPQAFAYKALRTSPLTSYDNFNVSSSGNSTFRTYTDGASAFVVKNANNDDVMWVDTSTSTLSVRGNVATTATTASVFNTNVTNLSIGGVATTLSLGASTGTTTVNNGLSVSGSALFRNTSNSATAFQVQNSSSQNLINVNTQNNTIDMFNSSVGGSLNAWATASTVMPAQRAYSATTTYNGYVYVMGGHSGPATFTSTSVYYAKLNADGSTGAWQTNANSLPTGRQTSGAVAHNGYLYLIGGNDAGGSTPARNVYYAKLNADGSTGAWQTAAAQLPEQRISSSYALVNGYIYVMGGQGASGTVNTSVYARINPNGTLGTWQTSPQTIPVTASTQMSVAANGYVYFMGGWNGSATQSAVYYSKINSDGTMGAWQTNANSLNAPKRAGAAYVANGYVYIAGGYDAASAATSSVIYAKLNPDGTTGAWATEANALPAASIGQSLVENNGYLYNVSGSNGSTRTDTTYYTSSARLRVNATLDLVGLSGGVQSDTTAGVGGRLIAGDTRVIGTLQVSSAAIFLNDLRVEGSVSIGDQLYVAGNITTPGTISANTSVNTTSVILGTHTSGYISKSVQAGSTGFAANDVVVMANESSSHRAVTTNVERDTRVYGVATAAASNGGFAGVAIAGNFTVNIANSAAVSIGQQLVVSGIPGQVMVDDNATAGIVGYATSAKSAGVGSTVSIRLAVNAGQSTPYFRTGDFRIQNAAGSTSVFSVVGTQLAVGAGSTPANGILTIGTDTTTGSTGGIYFGTDTNLYRNAANILQTDDSFTLNGSGSNLTVGGTFTVQGTGVSSIAGSLQIGIAGSNTGTISLTNSLNSNLVSIRAVAPTGSGTATIEFPSIAGGSSDIVCLQNLGNCTGGGGGTGAYILNQTSQQTGANFNIDGSGIIGSTLSIGGNGTSNSALRVWNGTATSLLVRTDTPQVAVGSASIQAGYALTVNGGTYIDAASTSAFHIMNNTNGQATFNVNNVYSGMISNPDFELNTTGWNARNGATGLTRITTPAYVYYGLGAAQFTTASSTGSGIFTPVALSPNTQYTLSFFARVDTATTNVVAGRQDVNGTDVNCSGKNFSVTTGFERYTCTFTTGATITSPNIFIKSNSSGVRNIFVDAVQLVPGAEPAPFAMASISARGVFDGPVFIRPQSSSDTIFQVANADGKALIQVSDVGNQSLRVFGDISSTSNLSVAGGATISTLRTNSITRGYNTSGTVNTNDVVVLNSAGQVAQTTTVRDTKVIGVWQGPVVVTDGNTTVNADSGEVQIGDQLVTSGTAGAVMSDNYATAGIVGYATSYKASGAPGTVTIRVKPSGGQSAPYFRTGDFRIQNAAGDTDVLRVNGTQLAVGAAAVPGNGILTIGTDSTTGPTGGLYFGTDTNLYRSAANILQSDDSLVLNGVGANLTVGGNILANNGIINSGSATATLFGDTTSTAINIGGGTAVKTITIGAAVENNQILLRGYNSLLTIGNGIIESTTGIQFSGVGGINSRGSATNTTNAVSVYSGGSGGNGTSTGVVTIRSGDGSGTNTSSGNIVIQSGITTGSGTKGHVVLQANGGGRVGIGTSTPGQLFDVQGGTGIVAQFSGRVVGAAAGAGNEFVTLNQANGNYINNGTSTQTANFAIQSSATNAITASIRGMSGQTADLLNIRDFDVDHRLEVKSDTSIEFTADSGAWNAIKMYTVGASNPGFAIRADGQLQWGNGVSAADILLARSGAGVLGLSGSLNVNAATSTALVVRNGSTNVLTIDTSSSRSAFNGATSAAGLTVRSGALTTDAALSVIMPNTLGNAAALRVGNGTADYFSISAFGKAVFRSPSGTNPADFFQVQNSSGNTAFGVNVNTQRVFINMAYDDAGAYNVDVGGNGRFSTTLLVGNTLTVQNGVDVSGGSSTIVGANVNINNTGSGLTTIGGSSTGGNVLIQGAASSTITLGNSGQTGTIQIGNSTTNNQTINIGHISSTASTNVNILEGANTGTINIGRGFTSGSINIGGSGMSGDIRIGNSSSATGQHRLYLADATTANGQVGVVKIATSATGLTGRNEVTIGSTNASSFTLLQGGTGVGALSLQTAGGSILVGSNGAASTIQIGNTSGAVSQTINIGNNATLSSNTTINIGSIIGGSQLNLQSGSNGVIVKGASSVTAFQVKDANDVSIFRVNTSTGTTIFGNPTGSIPDGGRGTISLCGTGSFCSGSKVFFGDGTADSTMYAFVGEAFGNDSDALQLHGSNGVHLTTGGTASNIGASITSDRAVFKSFSYNTTAFQVLDFGNTPILNVSTSLSNPGLTVTGAATIYDTNGTASSFRVQNGSGQNIFVADSSNGRINIGEPVADANGIVLVLDNKNTSGDPTGTAGGMYYNADAGNFRCYVGTAWQDCGPQRKTLTSDFTLTNSAAWNDVPTMSFSMQPNTAYSLRCQIIFASNTTVGGVGYTLNGPGSPISLAGTFRAGVNSTSEQTRMFRAYNNGSTTTDVDTANGNMHGELHAVIHNGSTAGTLQLRMAGELSVMTSYTKAGTNCELTNVLNP